MRCLKVAILITIPLLLGMIFTACCGPSDEEKELWNQCYDLCKGKIAGGSSVYIDNHGELPIVDVNTTVIIDEEEYYVIAKQKLTAANLSIPDLHLRLGYENPCVDCWDGSYIWAINENGTVRSACVGDGCKARNEDGFQGIWP